jgi:hypothetical protein
MNTVLVKKEIEKRRCNRRGGGDGDKSWIARIGGKNGLDGVGITCPDIQWIPGEREFGDVTIHAQVESSPVRPRLIPRLALDCPHSCPQSTSVIHRATGVVHIDGRVCDHGARVPRCRDRQILRIAVRHWVNPTRRSRSPGAKDAGLTERSRLNTGWRREVKRQLFSGTRKSP